MSSGILRRPLAFWDVSRKQNTDQAEIVTTILRFRDTRAFGVRLGPSPRASFTTLCDLCYLLFRNFLGVFLSQSLPGRCALFGRRRRIFFTEDRKDHEDNPFDVTVAFERYFFGVRPWPDRGDHGSSPPAES